MTRLVLLALVGLAFGCESSSWWTRTSWYEDQASGGVWSELGASASGGGVSNRGATARCQRLATNRAGAPYVAWTDDSTGVEDVYLRYWDGAWKPLGDSDIGGGISNGSGIAAFQNFTTCVGDLAFDDQDRPFVTWMGYRGADQPTFMRYWNGTAWRELASSSSGGGISGSTYSWWPVVAFDASGPLVAWSDAGRDYLRRFDGVGWSALGGSDVYPGLGSELGNTGLVSLAAGPTAAPHVAWAEDRTGNWEVYVARWTGASWAGLGGSTGDGGISQALGHAELVTVVLDGRGFPVVSWGDPDLGDAYIRRWNGTAWVAVGEGSLVAAGIASGVQNPRMALDSAGQPVLVWDAEDALGRNVHVARFHGGQWQSLASAEGGVSRSPRTAAWPEIAIGTDGTIHVVWEEDRGAGGYETYYRQYSPVP